MVRIKIIVVFIALILHELRRHDVSDQMDLMFGGQCLMKCTIEVSCKVVAEAEILVFMGSWFLQPASKRNVMMIRRKSLINGTADGTAIERICSIFGCEKVLAI